AAFSLTNSGGINVPANVVVGPGQSIPFPGTLTYPAPASGLFLSLVSSDTTKVTVTANVLVQPGLTAPATAPKVTGVGFGAATITVSAYGFPSSSQTVQS